MEDQNSITPEIETQSDSKSNQTAQSSAKEETPKKSRFGTKSSKDKSQEVIQDLNQKLIEANDKYLRLYSEFDNFRKRTIKEKADMYKTAGQDVIVSVIGTVDDFERALKITGKGEENKAHREGLELIYNKFIKTLEQKGVKEIDALGKDFDTDMHEALTQIPAPTPDLKGKVIDVIEKGYMISDKVIRFAKVVVGQ
jgi:molecular chaperone GrpE